MKAAGLAIIRIRTFGAALMAAMIASACAGTPVEHIPSLISETGSSGGGKDTYVLSPQELNYSCKQLTGTMQVRILQVRQYDARSNPSVAARGMQTVATPIFGGTTTGIDPQGQHRRDLAMLKAYNRQLATKKCKTFDLEAELKKTDPTETPRPSGPKKSP
jgi:hypothetical protein